MSCPCWTNHNLKTILLFFNFEFMKSCNKVDRRNNTVQ